MAGACVEEHKQTAAERGGAETDALLDAGTWRFRRECAGEFCSRASWSCRVVSWRAEGSPERKLSAWLSVTLSPRVGRTRRVAGAVLQIQCDDRLSKSPSRINTITMLYELIGIVSETTPNRSMQEN